jgi:hypothetical protein
VRKVRAVRDGAGEKNTVLTKEFDKAQQNKVKPKGL